MLFRSSAWRAGSLALAALTTVLLGPVASLAQNPPLAEVARKEQERRKTVKASGKVLTNKDLPPVTAPAPAPAPPAATAASETTPAEPKAAEAQKRVPERDSAWWKARITDAGEALRRNEVFLEALQSRVNALSADFAGRDDPYQRARIGEERQKALVEMERVKAEIGQAKQQIEDIEEEARKAGVPPGWLR
jgi:hypothetical protein